ncbi:MAG: NAD(P)-dependent oxidoreductase [Saccharofermentans sp.]|nr:NAD(P)-dependent oxidoreductase [Saccharofermentans sp.]
MNYLILGGNGFLGSKIVRMLLSKGNAVICTKRENSDLNRLNDLNDRINWVGTDIVESGILFEQNSIDCVINVACNYGRQSVLYGDVLEANIEFPLKVLNKITEYGIRRFMTIGTGLPDEFNMYSFSKKMFSEFGRFYHNKHGVSFYNLKLEMFYGPDEPRDRFIPSVIDSLLKGKDVDTSVGTQKRDIIFVEDIVKAVFLVLDSDLKGYYEIPVGTGEAPTISELLDYIKEMTGSSANINKGAYPMRADEPDCVADTSFLKSLGDWNPTPWKKGIADMIEKMREE